MGAAMAVTITVEDGSIVDGANSYATVAELSAWAEQRGVSLPATDDAKAVLLIKAADYLETFGPRFKGEPVEPGVQALAWPRKGVTLPYAASPLPEDAIPVLLKRAQLAAALAAASGIELLPATDAGARGIKREKTGPIETEYFGSNGEGATVSAPVITAVDVYLAGLLSDEGDGFTLQVGRA
jgi:hypothetical protein